MSWRAVNVRNRSLFGGDGCHHVSVSLSANRHAEITSAVCRQQGHRDVGQVFAPAILPRANDAWEFDRTLRRRRPAATGGEEFRRVDPLNQDSLHRRVMADTLPALGKPRNPGGCDQRSGKCPTIALRRGTEQDPTVSRGRPHEEWSASTKAGERGDWGAERQTGRVHLRRWCAIQGSNL